MSTLWKALCVFYTVHVSRLKHALCVLDTLHVFVSVGEEEVEEEDDEEEEEEEHEITNFKDRSFLSAVKKIDRKQGYSHL